MPNYRTTIHTDWEPETAFEYLAEFDNIDEWDPGVESARRLSERALEVGARFELELNFMGRGLSLTYETVSIDPPREVVLRAENATIVSLDRLHFDPAPGGGTEVTYDAELELKGPLKIASPLMQLAFNRLGDAARDGLARRLAGDPPTTASERRSEQARA